MSNVIIMIIDYWLLFGKLIDADGSVKNVLITRLLASWYCNQLMHVCWQNVRSASFSVYNGVRQGGILSPFLFRFYIRNLIDSISQLNICCNVGDMMINVLAYADDLVLLAPSWRAMQTLLSVSETAASQIDMTFNTKKLLLWCSLHAKDLFALLMFFLLLYWLVAH